MNEIIMNENTNKTQAAELWKNFKEYIFHKNRFFITHQVLDIVNTQAQAFCKTITVGQVYFRARIIDDAANNDHTLKQVDFSNEGSIEIFQKSLFKGLTKEGSFVPRNNFKIRDGRANPKFIKYLYVTEDPTTALFEVRPLIFDRINLAEIKVNETLKIADISVDLDATKSINSVEDYILNYIQGAFSIPTNNIDDYIPAQIISEYIKSLGYDGVRFKSSLHRGGINLTIYNYNKCEATSSRDLKLEDMKITARDTMARGNDDYWWIVDNKPIMLHKK